MSLLVSVLSCSTSKKYSINIKEFFCKEADVGWLPQMEATGYKFYDTDGIEKTTVYSFERQRNEYHSSSCLGKIK
jgi:arabinogalactan endo-1,4-beta-galactosidase